MKITSPAYQNEMKKSVRGQAFIQISLGVIDVDAADTAIAVDNDHIYFSDTESTLKENAVPKNGYATFEPRRFKANGTLLIPPENKEKAHCEGFVSSFISNKNCIYTNAPAIYINFTKPHSVPALSFVFDAVTGDYPTQFKITAYNYQQILLDKIYLPDNSNWNTQEPIERFTRLELEFLSSNLPFRRARLQKLTFGIGMVFESKKIISATQKDEIDPICRRLPQTSLDFTLVNFNNITGNGQYMYDADKPNGIWSYMELHAPITLAYGREITDGLNWRDVYSDSLDNLELSTWKEIYEGGTKQWINGGIFYLTSKPTINENTALFKAEGLIDSLNNTFYKGVYNSNGATLYDLAVSVLQDANLPQIVNDVPYRLWEGLKTIKSFAPMPVKKHKECLQLIAHAGQCVLFSRNGYIFIMPSNKEKQDFKLDFKGALHKPKVTKVPELKGVRCAVFQYSVEPEISELYKGTHTFDREEKLQISFAQATDIVISVSSGKLWSENIYATAADIIISGDTSVEIIITGKKLVKSETSVFVSVVKADENAEIEKLDNPLITDIHTATNVSIWVREYLVLRNTYEIEIRGAPELEPLDKISAQSQFTTDFSAKVLKTETNYGAGLNGKVTLKRLE